MQTSTAELFGEKKAPPSDAAEAATRVRDEYDQATGEDARKPLMPNVGGVIFVDF